MKKDYKNKPERTDKQYMHRKRRHSNEKFVKERAKAYEEKYLQMLQEEVTEVVPN